MIRLAVYNDYFASADKTPEEEAEEIRRELDNYLMDFVDLKEHSTVFNPEIRADIVVLDYGGVMWSSYDYVRSTTRSFLDYLENHESVLGIVWSSFNRTLVEEEFKNEFESMSNLIFRYEPRYDWNKNYGEQQDEFRNNLDDWFQTKPKEIIEIPDIVEPEENYEEEVPYIPETTNKKKTPTIKDFPYVEFTVRAYDTRGIKQEDGTVIGLAVFQDFVTDVTDDEDNELGSVGGGTGSVVISLKNGGYFQIKHDDLWYALIEALGDKKTLCELE